MKILNLSILLVLASVASASSSTECSNPSIWCEDIATAQHCNVLNQCLKYIWHPENVKVSNPVELTLYYEVLCPDCRQFVAGELNKALKTVGSIMNLTLVPYGNGREKFDEKTGLWKFTCQHGVTECWGNTLHNCLMHFYPQVDQHFPFIYCMESAKSNRGEDIHDLANRCAKQLQMPIDEVLKCVSSPLGKFYQKILRKNYSNITYRIRTRARSRDNLKELIIRYDIQAFEFEIIFVIYY